MADLEAAVRAIAEEAAMDCFHREFRKFCGPVDLNTNSEPHKASGSRPESEIDSTLLSDLPETVLETPYAQVAPDGSFGSFLSVANDTKEGGN